MLSLKRLRLTPDLTVSLPRHHSFHTSLRGHCLNSTIFEDAEDAVSSVLQMCLEDDLGIVLL